MTLLSAMLGIASLGVAFSGYLLAPLEKWERWWLALASLLFIALGLTTMAVGIVLTLPIVILQLRRAQAKQSIPNA